MKRNGIKFLAIAALAVVAIFIIASQTNLPTQILGSPSPIQFQACINHTDSSQACNNSVQLTKQGITDSSAAAVANIQISNPTVNNPFNVAPLSWSIAGTASWSTGANCAISASGSGAPPSLIPLSIPCSSLSASQLQTSFGSNYGQKNVTATLSGFVISGTFSGLPPVTFKSPRVAYANFVLNYGATVATSSSSSTISTFASTSTTSMSSSTSTSILSSTSTSSISGGTVTTGSSTSQWVTTITSASAGATGNTASNGIIATLAPDYYFPTSQSVIWVYFPSAAYSQCNVGIFVTVVTPSQSVTVGRLTASSNSWVGGIAFPMAVTTNSPYLLQVLCGNSASTMLFNQVVYASVATNSANYGANLPPSPYDAQYIATLQPVTTATTTTSSTALCTGYKMDGTPVYGYDWKTCNTVMSIISIGF